MLKTNGCDMDVGTLCDQGVEYQKVEDINEIWLYFFPTVDNQYIKEMAN